jgi:hypothetical protein
MAKKTGLGNQLYVGGYDLSGDVGAITALASPRPTLEVTSINKSAVERLMRRGDGVVEFNTWFDDAANAEHDALKGLPTADAHVMYAHGTTLGDVAAGLVAKQLNYDWTRNQDGSLQGTVRCEANASVLEWGKTLTAGVDTHAGATNGTSVDDGASSSNGIAGYLQLLAFTGTDITVSIEESSDDGAADPWTTKLTFTQQTAARKAERKTASGTVERYLRVSSSGTFTSADIAVMYRRGDANDDEAY